MIREYLKLARSFNAVLTGISPVMGAIAMEFYNIPMLFLLFLVGFFGHIFGFVLNDIIDYRIDKSSKEISDRPLISGTISIKNAWIFAISSMTIVFIVAFYIALATSRFFPLIVLVTAVFFAALYDAISKKAPGMDIFVALGVFFLIAYGASIVVDSITQITKLAWIVCALGGIQVLFMQIVAGGMKDIENDFKKGAKTLAVKMGVRVTNGILNVSLSYKALAYAIQITSIILVFVPFVFIWNIQNPSMLNYSQYASITIMFIIMLFSSHKLLSMKKFDRSQARKYMGIHYYSNFSLVPIMLMTLNYWNGTLILFPALGFILSNIILHGTFLQPKTM